MSHTLTRLFLGRNAYYHVRLLAVKDDQLIKLAVRRACTNLRSARASIRCCCNYVVLYPACQSRKQQFAIDLADKWN